MKNKGPSPFKIWCEETNYSGHKNKYFVRLSFGLGIIFGSALGAITYLL